MAQQDLEVTTSYGDRVEAIHRGGQLRIRFTSMKGRDYSILLDGAEGLTELIDELKEHAADVTSIDVNKNETAEDVQQRESIHLITTPYRMNQADTEGVIAMLKEVLAGL